MYSRPIPQVLRSQAQRRQRRTKSVGTLRARWPFTRRHVFPDRQIVDIPRNHSLFHTVYDLDEVVQIPGIYAALSGVTFERDGVTPQWRGIYDDHGHLMVLINFNMDLGDAWEHADVPQYALRYTNQAYQHAINYIVYAMTH